VTRVDERLGDYRNAEERAAIERFYEMPANQQQAMLRAHPDFAEHLRLWEESYHNLQCLEAYSALASLA
jgi:2-oxo-4-hydroxy-4-carboxy--5-ureidoimidazoline (OHCU) decarboxylase